MEYTDAQDVPFEEACSSYDGRPGFVLRDRDLVPAGADGSRRAHLPLSHGTDGTRRGDQGA